MTMSLWVLCFMSFSLIFKFSASGNLDDENLLIAIDCKEGTPKPNIEIGIDFYKNSASAFQIAKKLPLVILN